MNPPLAFTLLLARLGFEFLILLWWGHTLTVLWQWFIVPLGLPSLTLTTGAGIMLIARLFRPAVPATEEFGRIILFGFGVPLILLGFGLIIR